MFRILYSIQLTIRKYTFNYFTDCFSVEYDKNKYLHEKLLWDNIHPCWRLQLLYNETDTELVYTQLHKVHDTDEYINYKFNREKRKHKYVLNDWYQNIIPTKLNSKDQYVTPLQTNKRSNSFPLLPDYFEAIRICDSLTLVDNKLYLAVPSFTDGYYYFFKDTIYNDKEIPKVLRRR